ncbi:MAG: pyridoxamine 5'-phosphate oxidase family protein [Acidimicrobiales bacterium]
MRDIMWARPDGERVLLADGWPAAAFISAVYQFDRVEVVDFEGESSDRRLRLRAGPVALDFTAGGGWRLPFGGFRPPGFTRWIEGPVARAAVGVRTYGTTPSGVREWYRADEYRPLATGSASVDGVDAGRMVGFDTPAGFGFSEPPRRPAMVKVRPLLEDGSGNLEEVVAAAGVIATAAPASRYHDGSRRLQDRFDSREQADRLEERVVRTTLTSDQQDFVGLLDCFFLATADAAGRPSCSYKGGEPGLLRVLDDHTLAFPSYDGNGMFVSLGNALVNPEVGLLLIDFVGGRRMRIHGRASIDEHDPLLAVFEGAQAVVRVAVREVFPNCSRRIQRTGGKT